MITFLKTLPSLAQSSPREQFQINSKNLVHFQIIMLLFSLLVRIGKSKKQHCSLIGDFLIFFLSFLIFML